MKPELMTHIAPLADRFDYFIIDLWGVMHDGLHTYPGALAALESLRNRNKKIIFLSNAPRRAEKAIMVLDKLGIGKHLYDHLLTSGEVTHHHLAANREALGKHYVYIGPGKDMDLAHGLDYEMVEKASDADFALITGYDSEASTFEEKREQFEDCLSEKLPLICANPDMEVVRQNGTRQICAGLFAKEYIARGGAVTYFGKPYSDVYHECMAFFGAPDVSKICAIGDALETDIKGANAHGIFSVLCTGGILAAHLGCKSGALPDATALEKLCTAEKIFPKVAIPAFVW